MELKRTITSIFMVPTLGINRDKLIECGFINAYAKQMGADNKNCIYLLFKPPDIDKFQGFLDDEYSRTENLISDYNHKDYIILVYHLDLKWKNDYSLIRQGRYSETSKEFQGMFPKLLKNNKTSLQTRIFNKTEDLREYWEDRIGMDFKDEMEVWDGYNEESETLDLDKL